MYAYRFAGYWRDVGTIDSLWEANMEVLDPENSGIDIFDKTWKIYSRNPVLPAQKIGERAVVPVSYTHLDVYKRQPRRSVRQGAAGAAGAQIRCRRTAAQGFRSPCKTSFSVCCPDCTAGGAKLSSVY